MRQNFLKPYLVISTAMILLSTAANATSTDIENFKSEVEQPSGQSPIVVTIDMAGVSENDHVVSQPCLESVQIQSESNAAKTPEKTSWSFWWQTKVFKEQVSVPIKSDLEIAEQTKNPSVASTSVEKVEDKYPFRKTVIIRRIGYLGGWLLGIGSDVLEIAESEYNYKEFFEKHYPGYVLVESEQEKKETLQLQNNLSVAEPTVTIENSTNSISFELDSMEKGTEQTSQEVVASKPTINSEVLKKVAHALPENQDLTMSFISNFVQGQQIANEIKALDKTTSVNTQLTTPVDIIEDIKQKNTTGPTKGVVKNKKWN